MRFLSLSLLLAGLAGPLRASADLGENAGFVPGGITSNSSYPWYALSGEGPGGADCIISGSPFTAGDSSVAELVVVGPGVLTFQWYVDSAENDGWLTCDVWNGVESAEEGGITGSGAGWQHKQIFIPQGPTKVLWTYVKKTDTYEPYLDDAGRLAGVTFSVLTAAPQSFDDWKTAHGVTGETTMAANGLQNYSCWAMGLDPNQPVPADLNSPVKVGGEIRYRVRYSRAATVLLTPGFSDDLAEWTLRGARSLMVVGSVTPQTVDFDYFVPLADKRFFRCKHPPVVVPPPGFAYVPPGRFTMCSPSTELGRYSTEDFQHSVTLTKGFFLKQHETTYDEWIDTRSWGRSHGYPNLGYRSLQDEGGQIYYVDMGSPGGRFLTQANGGDITGSGPSVNGEGTQPVTNASWYESVKWLNAKSEREGFAPCYHVQYNQTLGGAMEVFRDQSLLDLVAVTCDWSANGYRLPTEAEWEYACRGRTTSALSNGTEILHSGGSNEPNNPASNDPLDPNVDPIAWYFGNGGASHPVGQKLPNSYGLYDMHGNAMEWCWDRFDDTMTTQFQTTSVVDPKGPAERGIYRVIRGGSWRNTGRNVRSACRDRQIPTVQGGYQIGFRIARNAN